MGLGGIIFGIGVIILGAGYVWFGRGGDAPLIMENRSPVSSLRQEVTEAGGAIGQAEELKAMLERQAEERTRSAEDVSQQAIEDSRTDEASEAKAASEAPSIVNRFMSSGFAVPKSPRKIDTVVLHSSYDLLGKDPYSVDGVIKEYEDYGVSAHYLIDRKGTIYRLVKDENIAYHAGASKAPDGRTNVNDFSIGIEMLNTKEDKYTDAQYEAVNGLVASLKGKYPIKSVVGHGDISPGRKTDPWNFNWKQLK